MSKGAQKIRFDSSPSVLGPFLKSPKLFFPLCFPPTVYLTEQMKQTMNQFFSWIFFLIQSLCIKYLHWIQHAWAEEIIDKSQS